MPNDETSIRVVANTSESLETLHELLDDAEQVWFSYAWMTSSYGEAEHWQRLPLDRIERGVIGLEFAQTEPYVLRRLQSKCCETVRVVRECQGTFHPKVIVARHGDRGRALVGSSNFTSAGFGRNVELNIDLHGPIDGGPIAALINAVEGYFKGAEPITDELLETYGRVHAARPRAPVIRLPRAGGPLFGIVRTNSQLDVEWADYFELLCRRHDESKAVFSRLANENSYEHELEQARYVFAKRVPFVKLAPDHRKFVCGLGKSTGWFGTTKSSGRFQHYVNTRSSPELKTISRALEHVPLTGPVDLAALIAPSRRVMAIDGVALGCWTRLLCAKRPDVFLSINGAVRTRIKQAFGHPPRTFEQYVELLERVHAFPWARAAKPDGDEHEIAMWRGRVAMLDALFYEPQS